MPDHALQWARVAELLENPSTRELVSELFIQRLLQMHHQLDGFELPDLILKLAARSRRPNPRKTEAPLVAAQHFSNREKASPNAHFDRLGSELRKQMAQIQIDLSKAEQARTKLLSDPIGAPRTRSALDTRQQYELDEFERQIDAHQKSLNELENISLALATLRGEWVQMQSGFILNAGIDMNAVATWHQQGPAFTKSR